MSRPSKYSIGDKIGKRTIIGEAGYQGCSRVVETLCECGSRTSTTIGNLKNNTGCRYCPRTEKAKTSKVKVVVEHINGFIVYREVINPMVEDGA